VGSVTSVWRTGGSIGRAGASKADVKDDESGRTGSGGRSEAGRGAGAVVVTGLAEGTCPE
jgi:hypothetical protein